MLDIRMIKLIKINFIPCKILTRYQIITFTQVCWLENQEEGLSYS